jgi:cytochrome c biogenesis protein CcmG/thiol:disulfide interchange protein DsbE
METAGEDRRESKAMWRYAIPVVLFLILGAFFLRGLYLNPSQIESPLIGKPAPAFTLPSLEDPTRRVDSSEFAGKYSLLNVWATWCPECRHEHEFLLQLAEAGVPIYGLNWKDQGDAARHWLATLGNPYVISAEDVIGDVAIDYGVYGAPETFLIAPDLTILSKRLGVMTPDVWERDFVPAIEAHRAAQ